MKKKKSKAEQRTRRNVGAFGQALGQARVRARIVQADAAKKIGVSRTQYGNWERGDALPEVRRLPIIAAVFGVDVSRLIKAYSEVNRSGMDPDYIRAFLKGAAAVSRSSR